MEPVELHANLLRSHSPNFIPPEPQRNASIAAVQGAVELHVNSEYFEASLNSSEKNKNTQQGPDF